MLLCSAKKNLKSATGHPDVISKYLQTEVDASWVVDLLPKYAMPQAHISRFGVIPKSHQPEKWRLIIDLSYPQWRSTNNGIPKELSSMRYITVDDAINKIIELSPGAFLAKIYVRNAFHLLPIHWTDRHLVAMEWEGKLYIDTCLPFGLCSAPKLFNILTDFLEWILVDQGASTVLHYLDDFLTIGRPDSPECQQNLQIITQVCQFWNIPLAL